MLANKAAAFSELLATLELANSPAGLVSLFDKIQYRLKRLSVALSPWDYRECGSRPIAPKDKNKKGLPVGTRYNVLKITMHASASKNWSTLIL